MKTFRLFGRESFDYQTIFSEHVATLRSVKSRDALLATALESLREIFNVTEACLLLKDDQTYILKERQGIVPPHFKLATNAPLLQRLAHQETPLSYDDLNDYRFENDRAFLMKDFVTLKAVVMLPLKIDGDLFGIIALGSPAGRRHFNAEEKSLLELFAYEMTFAIHNAVLHETLLKQDKQLKELTHLKNTFIANMTHELSTPLHHMIGLAQALADGGEGAVTAEQRQHLETIVRAGEHLLALHRTILDLSRLDSGGLQLNVKKMNIREITGELLPWLEAEAALKNTVVQDKLPADLPQVYIDEEKIRKVIQILMENASRYTSGGAIRLGGEALRDRLKISIEDTGTGIDPAYHQDIFEAFRQVDAGTSRQADGTGMGLALAKKILELHGEKIWLESEPDRGSRFFFTLPTRAANIPAFKMAD